MSEKVKLIIEIPKYYLEHPQDYTCLAECVRRGTPLNDVMAEIEKESNILYHDCDPEDDWKRFDVIRVDTVFDILDHTGRERIAWAAEKEAIEMCKVDVLDKIRAEIKEMPTISFNANDIYKADVLAIINKYKTESEE